MPLYEYLCRDCDHEVEVLVRSAEEQPVCPDCEGKQLTKLLSLPSAPKAGGPVSSGPASSGPAPGGPGGCGSGCGCHPH